MKNSVTNLLGGVAIAALGLLAASLTGAGAALAQEPLKVFVSAGFDGNTWMDASLNLLRAIAATPAYKDRVTLEIQSARGDAQTQQQQINAMVQAGADVIVAWPISPTALNRSVKNACDKGVNFITWDANVTESCAKYVGIDQAKAGSEPARWLSKTLGGKGNVVFLTGIPGTLVDTTRNDAAKAVFAESPDIKIVAEAPTMWNNATARQRMTEIVTAQGWDAIDGVWTQTGCYEFVQMQIEAGRKDFIPCAGNGENGFRVSMLKAGTTEGAVGFPGFSMGSPPWAAAKAFELGIAAHDGKDVPAVTEIPLPLVTQENSLMCETGSLAELKGKNFACTAVPLSVAPANYFIDVWSADVPELDLTSAQQGTVPAAN